jgi:hypothetical protein
MSLQQVFHRCCVAPEKRNNSRNKYIIIPLSAGVVGEEIMSTPLLKLIVSINLKKEFTGTKTPE